MTASEFEENKSAAPATTNESGDPPRNTAFPSNSETIVREASISDNTSASWTNSSSRTLTSVSAISSDPAQVRPTPIPIPQSILSRPKRQRFLPLSQSILQSQSQSHSTTNAPHLSLKGIIFDLDGTLCAPQTWMFTSMRAALGIPKSVDILTHITSLSPPSLQISAYEKIKSIETEAMKQMSPSIGLVPLLTYLSEKSIKKGICTRNFEGPVRYLISNFCNGFAFEPIITREFQPPKPHPAGLLHIAQSWGLKVGRAKVEGGGQEQEEEEMRNVIMVGDSMDDMIAGRKAGCVSCLLLGEHNRDLVNRVEVDVVISRLDDLVQLLDQGLEVFDDIPT